MAPEKGRRVYDREKERAARVIREAIEKAGPVAGSLRSARLYATFGTCGCCDARRAAGLADRIAAQREYMRKRRARLKQEAAESGSAESGSIGHETQRDIS